jgi:hypothetical protein
MGVQGQRLSLSPGWGGPTRRPRLTVMRMSGDLLDLTVSLPRICPPVLDVRSLLGHRLISLRFRYWPRITLVPFPARRKRVVPTLPSQRTTHPHPLYHDWCCHRLKTAAAPNVPPALLRDSCRPGRVCEVLKDRLALILPSPSLPPSPVSVAAPTGQSLLPTPYETA